MVQTFIIHEHHPRLLLFFAGWGADATPFKHYRPERSDFLLCYDYRTLYFDRTVLREYKEVNLIGWSMGVWAATQVMERHAGDAVMGRSIAINGTPYPVDDGRGIPTAVYHGTLEGLTGVSLHKFLRRMCADGKEFRAFLEVTPRRPLEELREELMAAEAQYSAQCAAPVAREFKWSQAVVGTGDRIIPPENQRRAWHAEGTPVILTDDAHYSRSLFQYYLQDIWTNN